MQYEFRKLMELWKTRAGSLRFLIVGILLLQGGLQSTPFFRDLETRFQVVFYDMRFAFQEEPSWKNVPIYLLQIDDASLPSATCRSPVNRAWLAELIDQLAAYRPHLIVFNLLLDQPTVLAEDQRLADAIKRAGNVILREEAQASVLESFAQAAVERGSLRFQLDSSGTLKAVCNTPSSCGHPQPLPRVLWQTLQPEAPYPAPFQQQDWLAINFFRTDPNFVRAKQGANRRWFGAQDIAALSEEMLPDNAVVLIGTGFEDLYPAFKTPFFAEPGETLNELEVLSQILEMLLTPRPLKEVPWYLISLILAGVMGGLGWIALKGHPIAFGGLTLFAILGWMLGAAVVFAFADWVVVSVLPAILLGSFFIIFTCYLYLRETWDRLALELDLKQTKIDFLTQELNRHSLFNEFSRIRHLISRKPETAQDYLIEFADRLQTSLRFGDRLHVPLSEQVRYIQSYITQQQLLYGETLQFDLKWEGQWEAIQTPWNVFYPLVENAVKYTEPLIGASEGEGPSISVELAVKGNRLQFSISNPYREKMKVVSSKKGLRNLQQRLNYYYKPGSWSLESRAEGQRWLAKLIIPVNSERE